MFHAKKMFIYSALLCLAQSCISYRVPTVINCTSRSKTKIERVGEIEGSSPNDSIIVYNINKYKKGRLNGLHFSYNLHGSVELDGVLFLREVGHYRMGTKSGLWIYYTGNGYYNRWVYYFGSIAINARPKTPKNSTHTVEYIDCK